MRPSLTALILTLAATAHAAPAPFPRGTPSLEQNATYREADADVRASEEQTSQAERDAAEISPKEFIAKIRSARALAKRGAEKFAKLADLSGLSPIQRDALALKTGRAWALAGDCRQALPCFEAAYKRPDGPLRAEAMAEAILCHWRLGQNTEVRRLAVEVRPHRAVLPEALRERLDNVLRWAEQAR